MNKRTRFWRRIIVMAICSLVLALFGTTVQAQDVSVDDLAAVQVSIDSTWVLIASFLVFFMQTGFALLEAGMIRQTGAVNSLMENFMDACIGGLTFWAVGYAIAFGVSQGGLFGASNFFLSEALTFADGEVAFGGGMSMFVLFFFQFAFAATAGTIATGGMAERTSFVGKIIYTVIVAAIIYPVVVHWVWGGGWLFEAGFLDFAGSTVVHMVGGVIALVGAIMLGARKGRVWGSPPRPHNLALATLGALILWFGWYGFNPGSALGMGNNGLVGLVAVNTTLAGCAGAIVAVLVMVARTGKWDLPFALNGALAGLVGITAGCAFVAPWASVVIGMIAGALVIAAVDVLERLRIDDAVGAFAVHGVCGAMGTLAIGFLGQPELGANGLLLSGDISQLLTQLTGVVTAAAWAGTTSLAMFAGIKAIGRLRIPAAAEAIGIDLHEHGTTVWPDLLPVPAEIDVPKDGGMRAPAGASAAAAGD